MQSDNTIMKLAEAWLEGGLSADDMKIIEERKLADAAWAAEFQDCVNILRSIKGSGEHKRFKAILNDIHNKVVTQPEEEQKTPKTVSLFRNHWRTAAIAAGIAMITSLTTFWATQYNNKQIASQYRLLRRDLETYKRSQHQIITDIKSRTVTPQLEARYTGTGFALTNNGYIVTSYHVVSGADSVYIQHRDGNYYKASPVAFDEHTDVVILKVEDSEFRFSKQDIPYTVAKDKKKLGSRVFTLGFPQDEIVYNEGYISAKNGYGGDSNQYRLDIPAGPGQSGAPVVDASGTVVGIITGKESESEGTTYAVASEAIVALVNSLPKENSVKMPAINKLSRASRETQIEKLEYYTCAIKVYKK